MGSVCCCFGVPDVEGNANSTTSNDANSLCFNRCIQNLITTCVALFGREEMHRGPSPSQESASPNSMTALNNDSIANSSHNDRPLLNNASTSHTELQQDVMIRRYYKGSGNSRVEPEPLSGSIIHLFPKSFNKADNPFGSHAEKGSTKVHSDSSEKLSWGKVESTLPYVYPSSDDEDVCPTCLEEYRFENPKIITKCSHHYHLGCIYEWMERSETCPVCGKLMEFDETT